MTPETSSAAGIAYLRRPQPQPLQEPSPARGRGLGEGKPPHETLVLLHGIGSDAESWVPLMRALDPQIDAIAWNAPGYGESAPVTTPTPTAYADRLARFLDALRLDRIVLAGHSLGCLFAASFAAAHPDRVVAMALLSPALGYGIQPGATLPPTVQARIDDLENLGPVAFAAKRAGRLVHRPHALPGVRRAMSAVRLPGYAQAVHALAAGTLLADAARIAAPTRVAVGTHDVVTPPANARAVHAALPNPLALDLIAEAGHALPQEAPDSIAQLLGALMPENADV